MLHSGTSSDLVDDPKTILISRVRVGLTLALASMTILYPHPSSDAHVADYWRYLGLLLCPRSAWYLVT